MNSHVFTLPISAFLNSFGEYNFSARYQRDKVWTPEQKSALIKSVLIGIPLPLIYLLNTEDNGTEFEYEVVDGKQRLNTIRDFVNDEFVYENEAYADFDEISGKKFSEFPTEFKRRIKRFKLSFVELWDMDEVNIDGDDLFLLVNKGTAISHTDKRRAMKSNVFDYALQLNAHPVMDVLRKTKSLSQKQEFSDILLLLADKGISHCGAVGLRKFYEEYVSPSTFASRHADVCRGFLDFLYLNKDGAEKLDKIVLRDMFIFWKEARNPDAAWFKHFVTVHNDNRTKPEGLGGAEFQKACQKAVTDGSRIQTRINWLRNKL